MTLSDYLQLIRKYWASISAFTLLGLAAAAAASLLATPTYSATTSLYVSVQSSTSASDLASGSSYTERQVKSFAEIAVAPIVLQPVIDRLQLGESPDVLAKRVTVSVPINTSILNIAVLDTDAQRAAATAGAVGDQLVKTVADMSPKGGGGQADVVATVISPATVPNAWASPKVARNLLLGLVLGLLLGVGQALLRHVLDTRVRTTEDVATITDLPVVGTVPWEDERDIARHPLAVLSAPNSLRAEAYRRLRTNLQFLGVNDERPVIAFTSSIAGEGKTATVLNLALALVSAGKRVLLIDADLRRPRVAKRLRLEGSAGLTTVLIGRASLVDVVQPVHGLDVLTAGEIPPNPSELLGSDAMRMLIRGAVQYYDYVLLDTAPLVPVADTAVLGALVSGVVVLVGSGQVDAAELEEGLTAVEAADGTVLGLVINKLRMEDAGPRRYAYYYEETAPGRTAATATDTATDTRSGRGRSSRRLRTGA